MTLVDSLTFTEARRQCEAYEHIIGSTFLHEGRLMAIQQVVASPYDEINKYIFFHFLLESGSPSAALEFYRVPFYDVLVIYRQALDGSRPAYLPLRAFLEKYATGNPTLQAIVARVKASSPISG
jgi:hypothetical protein